jgi:hypothetical protein
MPCKRWIFVHGALEACKGTMLDINDISRLKSNYKTFPNLIKNLKPAI